MTPYYIFIISNYVLLLLSKKIVFKISNKIKVNIFFFLSLIFYIIFYGFRYDVGADYWNYKNLIENIWENGYINFLEPGFNLLIIFLGKMNFNYRFFLILTAIFSGISLYYFVYKFQNKYYELSLFIYFTTFPLFFSSFNIIRQYIAIFIFVFGLVHLFNKNYILYYLISIISISVHFSLFIILLVVPLLLKKYNKILLIALLLSASLMYFTNIHYMLFFLVKYFLELFNQSKYLSYLSNPVSTFSYSLFIYDFVFLSFIIMFKDNVLGKNDKFNFFLNSYLFYFILKGLFPFEIFYRGSFFFLMSKIIIIPQIINVFSKKSKNIIYILLIIIHILAFIPSSLNKEAMIINNYYPYEIEFKLHQE